MNNKFKDIAIAGVAAVTMLPAVVMVASPVIVQQAHAQAQQGARIIPVPTSFCAITALTTAISLSSACSAGIAAVPGYLVICAYGAGVNYRDDGVAPTATIGVGGQGITAGQCLGYNGAPNSLQFWGQTAGATLGVSFYR